MHALRLAHDADRAALLAERRAEADDTDDEVGTSAGHVSPRDWLPRVPHGAPAVACYAGTAAEPSRPTSLYLAPDLREWRDLLTWRRELAKHLGLTDVAIRLEAVGNVDTMRGARLLGEWAPGVEPTAYADAPPVVHVQLDARTPLKATILTVVGGVARYAVSPAALAELRARLGGGR
jgi:hypothetical protein